MKYDKYYLSKLNKREVIHTIRNYGPISRSEIAEKTRLSIPTVMKITEEYINNGLVNSAGIAQSTGGKPPELLKFNQDVLYILGLDIGRNHTRVALINLGGEVIEKTKIKTDQTNPPEELFERIFHMIDELLKASNVDTNKVFGLGIGVPGLIDVKKGKVKFSPDFDWEDILVLDVFKNRYSYNILVENSNRTLALGELWFGAGANSDSLFCINLGHGIGSSIIENNDICRGSRGHNGEFGHISIESNGPKCSCGNSGCLEVLASGNAIKKQGERLLKTNKSTLLHEIKRIKGSIEAKDVFDAAKKGDQDSQDIINQVAEYIGIGIVSAANLIDPDIIILGGGLVKSKELLMPKIIETVKKRKMKGTTVEKNIKIVELGEYGTAIGAASLILKKFIDDGGVITNR